MKKLCGILLLAVLAIVFTCAVAGAQLGGIKKPAGLPTESKMKPETVSLTLKDLSKGLEKFEATDMNPVTDSIKYNAVVYGDAGYDQIAKSTAKMELGMAFTNNVLKDANQKIEAAAAPEELQAVEDNLKILQESVGALVNEGTKTISSAKQFASDLGNKAGKDPMGYGKYAKDMTKVLERAPKLMEQLPKLLDTIGETLKKVGEKKAMLTKGV